MVEKINISKGVAAAPRYPIFERLHWDRPLILRLTANLAGWSFIFVALYFAGLYSYLLFHSFAELLAIIIASGVFIFTWNTRAYLDNNYLRFIGISFLFTAIFDSVHMLAYEGINIFTNQGTNLASQLWIAARYLQSLTFLAAPLFFTRNFKSPYVIAAYALITFLLLVSIFYWQIFPVTYIEGSGLTAFKINSEYLISSILLVSAGLLLLNAKEFPPRIVILLTGSILITIASELAFTLYIDDYGFYNFLGHYLKIAAYYLLYTAILVTGLIEPYNLIFRKLKENQNELWQSMLQLQARNDELDAFAHTVAHDLKNPIAAISISLKTLDDTRMPDETRQSFLHDMRDTVDKMNGIIDSLLLLSMVRKTNVPSVELDMAQIIDRVMLRLNNLIQESHAEVILPASWPAAVGYPQWIEEVWVNYISNAIQNGGNPPQVEIGAMEVDSAKVRFWVKDNGSGIPIEDQGQLFAEFTQLKNVSQNGHGLGLSIVQRIIKRLGGEVGVESRPGQGSKFFFTLRKSR